jgi:hypothetical protein
MTAPARALAAAEASLRTALAEAKLAYEFSPGSYTYSCLHACLDAEQAVGALRAALVEQEPVEEGA